MKPDKERQRAYRRRMLDRGCRQFAFWLDSEAQSALNELKPMDSDLSAVISKAIKQYHSRMIGKGVSSHVSSNAKSVSSNVSSDNGPVISNVSSDSESVSRHVTSNVSSDSESVSRHVTSNVASNRYMSQDLEDHILELRQDGVTLKDIASRLASEGYLNAHGEPYNTSTISKAEARARKRQA